MKEDLQKKMLDYAENGDKSVFADHPTAISVTDRCADVYYFNFEGLSDDLRKSISNYILDNIFKQMVIPAIDEARAITRNNLSVQLQNYSDLALIDELIKRNGIGQAPTETKRSGEWCEVLVAAGDDETVSITFPDEALEMILRKEPEKIHPLNDSVDDTGKPSNV